MEITHENCLTKGCFTAKNANKTMGEMTYVWLNPSSFAINHTFVVPECRGQNVGNELLKKAVEYARENGLKIRPICSYAARMFDTHSEINDVKA